jgi:hypothetical protein
VYLLDFFQVMDYEAEQQRLLRLFEEVPTDIEYDDEEDSSEEDYVEERLEKSETEQELDSEEEVEVQNNNENVSKRAKWMRDTYYLGKDKETKWKKHIPVQTVRTRSVNLVTRLPGVRGAARGLTSIIDSSSCFFDDQMLNIILKNTNKSIDKVSDKYTRYRNARPTNIHEIKALLGLLYMTGVRKENHLNALVHPANASSKDKRNLQH